MVGCRTGRDAGTMVCRTRVPRSARWSTLASQVSDEGDSKAPLTVMALLTMSFPIAGPFDYFRRR
jgi:hypothetical protein